MVNFSVVAFAHKNPIYQMKQNNVVKLLNLLYCVFYILDCVCVGLTVLVSPPSKCLCYSLFDAF